jgi:hypothetical protein
VCHAHRAMRDVGAAQVEEPRHLGGGLTSGVSKWSNRLERPMVSGRRNLQWPAV